MHDSPWGPILVADAHVHFFSDQFFEALTAQRDGLTLEQAGQILGWRMPPHEAVALAAEWIAELDRHKVGVAALIGSVPGDQDSVAAAARAYPDRLYAHAMVNPRQIQPGDWFAEKFAEIRTACLFPAMHRFSMRDECVAPVFDWAQENRRAVFVHCGVLSIGVRNKLGLTSPFDMSYSNPIDLHRIALRYPEVPVIIPHFGAGYFREALMLADLCPNVYFDTSSTNGWMKYEGLTLREVFERALSVVGPERLLFGSDSSFFPRGWVHAIYEQQTSVLKDIGISAEDARAVLGKNLLRILTR